MVESAEEVRLVAVGEALQEEGISFCRLQRASEGSLVKCRVVLDLALKLGPELCGQQTPNGGHVVRQRREFKKCADHQ
jgi:hypothetical protein